MKVVENREKERGETRFPDALVLYFLVESGWPHLPPATPKDAGAPMQKGALTPWPL